MILILIFYFSKVCGLKWSYDNRELASGGNDNKVSNCKLNHLCELSYCFVIVFFSFIETHSIHILAAVCLESTLDPACPEIL